MADGPISVVNKDRAKVNVDSAKVQNSNLSDSQVNSSFFKKNIVIQNQINSPLKNERDSSLPLSKPDLANKASQQQYVPNLKFNLKITDISELSNPFIVYSELQVTRDGNIAFHQKYPEFKSISSMLPWIKDDQDIFRRTI